MSEPCYWRHKLYYFKRSQAGIDPTTRLPTHSKTPVLDGEPCDIETKSRRVGQQTPNGTVYNTVRQTILHVYPDEISHVPDQNDEVEVLDDSGLRTRYRVLDSTPNVDAADGRYMGSLLTVQAIVPTDASTI